MERKTIIDYVNAHFRFYFEVDAGFFDSMELVSAYSAAPFFDSRKPKPTTLKWKKWNETPLPVLFEVDTDKNWYTLSDKQLTLHYDIYSHIFYFLSGWQEEHCATKDQFGRFPYAQSIQKEHSFVEQPIVNYYFLLLREAFEAVSNCQIRLKQHYTLNITHDIDVVNSGWKTSIKKQLLKGRFFKASSTLLQKLISNTDPYQNIEELIQFEKKHRLKSTFYFLTKHDKQRGIQNADYRLSEPYIQQVIQLIKNDPDFELGLHTPVLHTLDRHEVISSVHQLGGTIHHNRFHYLALQQADLQHLENTSITTDSSLGFAEHIGFRHSCAWPFFPFNFNKKRAFNLLEVPLIAMDVSLSNAQYMHLDEENSLERLLHLKQETQKVEGTFTILWHNDKLECYKKTILSIV